jgi:multidrug transporter EmrE-like cation transporter
MNLILLFVYAVMSACGLFLLKTGVSGTSLAFQNGVFSFFATPRLLIGFALYVCSFLLSLYVMNRMKLSVFYPVSVGAILIITCVLSYVFLKEQIGTVQIVGIALILCGVVAINIK